MILTSAVLHYINDIVSRRVIDHVKEHGHNASLQKLLIECWKIPDTPGWEDSLIENLNP